MSKGLEGAPFGINLKRKFKKENKCVKNIFTIILKTNKQEKKPSLAALMELWEIKGGKSSIFPDSPPGTAPQHDGTTSGNVFCGAEFQATQLEGLTE